MLVYLFFYIGIPLVLTRSTHTEIGLSNGTIGIFKQLIYIEEEEESNYNSFDTTIFPTGTIFVRNPLYILLELKNSSLLPKLLDLPEKFVPIALENQNFDLDISKIFPQKKFKKIPKIKVNRKQFPLTPAYGFSTHKSQGLTIPQVIVDLIFPPPPLFIEPALTYVPLTRVKNLNDLAFFRDFPLSALQIPPSPDQKKELLRLEFLNKKTKRNFITQYPLN